MEAAFHVSLSAELAGVGCTDHWGRECGFLAQLLSGASRTRMSTTKLRGFHPRFWALNFEEILKNFQIKISPQTSKCFWCVSILDFIEIHLLPWNNSRKKKQKKFYKIVLFPRKDRSEKQNNNNRRNSTTLTCFPDQVDIQVP